MEFGLIDDPTTEMNDTDLWSEIERIEQDHLWCVNDYRKCKCSRYYSDKGASQIYFAFT